MPSLDWWEVVKLNFNVSLLGYIKLHYKIIILLCHLIINYYVQ